MSSKRPSVKKRIGDYLIDRVGEVVTSAELQQVAFPATEWARRVRELRAAGWPIRTDKDTTSLKPGQYCLAQIPEKTVRYYGFSPSISTRLRAEVLERNGSTCQMCGAAAGDLDDLNPGRKVRLHIGHIIDRSHGGRDELSNLRALCSTCNQGAKNITQEPPSWTWLLTHLRRASIADQRAALKWLKHKFQED